MTFRPLALLVTFGAEIGGEIGAVVGCAENGFTRSPGGTITMLFPASGNPSGVVAIDAAGAITGTRGHSEALFQNGLV